MDKMKFNSLTLLSDLLSDSAEDDDQAKINYG